MSIDYARMPAPQRWQWHAQVYALRRVVLDVPPDIRTSPCDLKGEWYDEHAVKQAETELRTRLAKQSRRCRTDTDARNAIRFRDGAAGHAEAAE